MRSILATSAIIILLVGAQSAFADEGDIGRSTSAQTILNAISPTPAQAAPAPSPADPALAPMEDWMKPDYNAEEWRMA